MRKWLKRAATAVGLILVMIAGAAIWSDSTTPTAVRYVSNEKLPTIKAGWKGTPVDADGRFVNDEFPSYPKYRDMVRWILTPNQFRDEKKQDSSRLEVKDPSAFLGGDADGILWLGHASFFIRLGGKSFLIDPIFGKPPFVKRFVDFPSPLESIRRVDYVLISHDHRDHMDETTLRDVLRKFPDAVIFAGLGTEDVLNEWKTPTNRLETAGWFQKFDTGADGPEIFYLPVRHWARRGLLDTNRRLWGSFLIRTDGKTVFFGGDSGYGRHYGEIRELFPEIDYFLVGIGAFEPRFIMQPSHNSPAEALQAFKDLGAKYLVPMHYGTFDLSDEPPSLPLKYLMAEAEKAGLADRIKYLQINESLEIK